MLIDGEPVTGWACWYPQMGGYVGRALVVPGEVNPDDETGGCFEAYVWHDGEFPFADGRSPARLHHCDAEQFVQFGEFVRTLGDTGERAQSGPPREP